MNTHAQQIALARLRDHPGWSDQRVADELAEATTGASASSVRAWREQAGLAPYTRNTAGWPPPRRQGLYLACGHLIHPERLDAATKTGSCAYCGRSAPLATGTRS